MAYRFLLEVPEPLAEDANTVVTAAPDAQVLIMRNSHGLGFDDPYMDLSIASHSLGVIETIYRWLADLGQPYPEIRLVLYDGRRVRLSKADASLVIAAIRRDQPWVEHTMPMIGKHEPKPWTDSNTVGAQLHESRELAVVQPDALIDRIDVAPSVAVHNLATAEQFYQEMLDLHLVARARKNDHGELEMLEEDYDPLRARMTASEADVVFLENGPLQLNLLRAPRGELLPYGTDPNHVRATATPDQIATIKGRILMNSYNLLDGSTDALSFLDPYNVIWTITPATAGATSPAALQG